VYRRSLLAAAVLTASGTAAPALAQDGALDFTMQVVDDVRDVGRVLDEVERRVAADAAPPGGVPPVPAADEPPRIRERGVRSSKDEFDRDEQSECELDDYDLPEDAVIDD
jgi:hypothetical protein